MRILIPDSEGLVEYFASIVSKLNDLSEGDCACVFLYHAMYGSIDGTLSV